MRILLAIVVSLVALPALAADLNTRPYREFALPLHGNWCGPAYGGGPAIDGLDAACRRHDLCIQRAGEYFNCGCDLALMNELRYRRWPSEQLYDKARGVYEAIALLPCRDPDGQAEKLDMFTNDRLGALLSGREPPFATVGRFLKMLSEGQRQNH